MTVRSLMTTLTAVMFAAGIAIAPASAHDGRNAALIGGLIAGALIGAAAGSAQGANPPPRYYYGGPPPGYGYRHYAPAYYPPPPQPYCGYPYPPCRY